MDISNINLLLRNNTGNKTKEHLVKSFVVRTRILNDIFAGVKSNFKSGDKFNYLIIGQRGAGKTTLLYRLKYMIEDDSKLNNLIIPLMFSEEQYNLMDLFSLWDNVIEYLNEDFNLNIDDTYNAVSYDYLQKESKALDVLIKNLNASNKSIIIFIENIDVFLKKIGKDGQQRLWSLLMSSTRITFICSSTVHFEGTLNSKEDFQNLFEIVKLEGLNKLESIKLLKQLAEQYGQTEEITNIIFNHPKRLESLRRLTGGNPRIISYLFQIFLDNENGKAILDLYKLLDNITFLYKAELDQLSAQQQKIIDTIARNWDALSTKEISAKTGIDSKHISSILNALEKNQVVESISTKTKNNLYRLKDRFLNIWYLMRFGKNKERANVIWLVRFYDLWCDKTELSNRINQHITNLKSGHYDAIAALDMGKVFLSCVNVPHDVKYDLYRTTKSVLPLDKIKELRLSETSLYNSITELVKKKNFVKAIEALSELEIGEKYYSIASWVYYKKGDIIESVDYLVKLFDLIRDADIAVRIGYLYEMIDVNKAVEYYKIAIENDRWIAYYYLGQLYYYEFGDINIAENYYKLGIEKDIDECVIALAGIFYNNGRLEDSLDIMKLALQNNKSYAKNYLAVIYQKQNKRKKAISLLKEAYQDGDATALISLGKLYMGSPKPLLKLAKDMFEKALIENQLGAYSNLARIYLKEKNKEKAEFYLLEGLEKRDKESAHLLGHLYCTNNQDWKKGEQAFVKSIKWGKYSALTCLVECALAEKKNDRKSFILKLFEDNIASLKNKPLLEIAYAKILVWNGQFHESVAIIKKASKIISMTFESDSDDDYKEEIMSDLTVYIMLLISKSQYQLALDLFQDKVNYKQILKPVYFALMNFMKEEYPNEYLKAGDELIETVKEIVDEINEFRSIY